MSRKGLQGKRVTVFGGAGFLGSYVVKKLADRGAILTVASLNAEDGKHLKPSGGVGQITLMSGNIRDEAFVRRACTGANVVINLVGILSAKGDDKFTAIHAQGAENIAKAAKASEATHMVHISAIAVNRGSGSLYARSKANGEKAVLAAFPEATIIRPSIIFGPRDNFFNMFAQMAVLEPILPLIGGGKNKLQPVYVADVADAIVKATTGKTMQGKIYELGGPSIYEFKQILEYILTTIKRKRILVNIPFAVATVMAAVTEQLPGPLLTRDQVKLLKIDSVVGKEKDIHTFKDLDISPTPMEAIVPKYLRRFG